MHRIIEICLHVVAKLLLHGNVDGVHAAYFGAEDPSHIVATIVEGYIACWRGSVERQMLRTVLASCK